MSSPFRTYAAISLPRIVSNFQSIKAVAEPGSQVAAVVKANAYGHGMIEVSRALASAGARWLCVSSVEEGIALREAAVAAPRILVMGGYFSYEAEALAAFQLTPAVHSLEQIRELDSAARLAGSPIAYHLKIDSGMGRLGTRAEASEILATIAETPHASLEGLLTHLASPSDFSSTQTAEQTARFREILDALCDAGVKPRYLHAASTGAFAHGRAETFCNMVRAGISLYGYVPRTRGAAPPQHLAVKPALTWKARLVTVKEIPEGALVGYGGTFRAPRPMRIGVAGAGYADGVMRSLSNRGRMLAAGRPAPILGAVSMDLTTIDLTHATALRPGDEVTLLGEEGGARIDAQDIADDAGTIPYEILCGIGARVHRLYT
ncbi:MAG TPA: alanine racemase [Bryobacteraceae bacterium]|nr:alanine racemase [Bryobacteraceae bacterium]